MSVVLTNNAVSKLASSLSSGATTLSVTSGEGSKFPSPSTGNWFPLTLIKSSGALEILRCTARSGDVFTVARAQEGTAAQAFSVGDRVESRLTAAVITEMQQAALDTVLARVGDEGSVNFRNKLINARGTVNQRAYLSNVATVAANQYTLDRWRVVTSGQGLTYVGSGNGRLMTAPAGGVEQIIEGSNIEGGVYTLSWSGTATATVNGVAITSGGQTGTLSANTDVTVRFSSGTFEKPQLELGTKVTPFEQRPTGLELDLCQRYFRAFGQVLASYYAGGPSTLQTPFHGNPMRATPTVVLGNAPTIVNASTISIVARQEGNHILTWSSIGVGQSYFSIDFVYLSAEL